MGENKNSQSLNLFDNESTNLNIESILHSLIQNNGIFAYNAHNIQLQIVPPIIQEKQEAFEQLTRALHQRYRTETAINKMRKRYPSDEEKLNAVRLAATQAYETWATHLPTIPTSYADFCATIEKRQAFVFNKTKRKLAIDRINLYIKLVAELYAPNNSNSSIVVQFQQDWTMQLDDARKKGKEHFAARFQILLENLQKATDKNKEPSERAIFCARLAKLLRNRVTTYLQEIVEIDRELGVAPHTNLIQTTTFTDFIFADPGANLESDNSYLIYHQALKQQEKNTNLLDEQEKKVFAEEVNELYTKIQNEVENDLLTHYNHPQTTTAITSPSLNM